MKHLHEVLLVLASLSGGSIPRPPPELVPSLNNKNYVKQKTSQLPIMFNLMCGRKYLLDEINYLIMGGTVSNH